MHAGTKLKVEILDETGDILILHDNYVTECSTIPTRQGVRIKILMTDAQGLHVEVNIHTLQ